MKKAFLTLMVIGLTLLINTNVALAAGKVTLTPTSLSLTESQSIAVQVQLDEPIIGPGPDDPYFELDITSGDPSRVTIDPNPVEFTTDDWADTKVFTVTAIADGIYNNGNNSITISFEVDSDSEYYNNYSGGLVLSITDLDPAPIAEPNNSNLQSTDSQAQNATLAETGTDILKMQSILLGIIITLFLSILKINKFDKFKNNN